MILILMNLRINGIEIAESDPAYKPNEQHRTPHGPKQRTTRADDLNSITDI